MFRVFMIQTNAIIAIPWIWNIFSIENITFIFLNINNKYYYMYIGISNLLFISKVFAEKNEFNDIMDITI